MVYNRINYGIHSICPFRISDGTPYGILKVLGGGTLSLTSEIEQLFGGSNKFAWAVEAKTISAEWTASVKSFPDFMFELFLGATVATTAASATGSVSALTNVKGTSVLNATTGIDSVAAIAGSPEDLKDGVYIVKAASATTVDVYYLTDIEAKKVGAANTLTLSDDQKVNSSPLTITASTDTDIAAIGAALTGGSGTIGMTADDTARFEIRSPHAGVSTISIGGSGTTFPEHRQLCLSQKRANGDTFELELYRVVGSGMPIPMEEQTFAIPELSMQLVQDTDSDKVAEIRAKRGI